MQWTPLAMVSTGLAVLLVMNLGWTLLRPDPQRLAARFEFVGPDPGVTVGNVGSVLDVSSDGSRFVFLGSGPTGGQLWHRPLDQLVSLPIPGTAGARSPRFSPDGESVVFRITAVVGVILVVFMIKPLFASSGSGQARCPVYRTGEPTLWAFVEQICKAVGAPVP